MAPTPLAERDAGILGVAPDMRDDPALEAEPGDRRAIGERPRLTAGEVSSIYSMPIAASSRAIAILSAVVKSPLANCSPIAQRGVDDGKVGKGHVADVALPKSGSGASIAHRLTNPRALYS